MEHRGPDRRQARARGRRPSVSSASDRGFSPIRLVNQVELTTSSNVLMSTASWARSPVPTQRKKRPGCQNRERTVGPRTSPPRRAPNRAPGIRVLGIGCPVVREPDHRLVTQGFPAPAPGQTTEPWPWTHQQQADPLSRSPTRSGRREVCLIDLGRILAIEHSFRIVLEGLAELQPDDRLFITEPDFKTRGETPVRIDQAQPRSAGDLDIVEADLRRFCRTPGRCP